MRLEHLSDSALVARIVIVSLGWILNNPKPAGGVLNRVVLNLDARKVGNCPGEQVAWIIECGNARRPTSLRCAWLRLEIVAPESTPRFEMRCKVSIGGSVEACKFQQSQLIREEEDHRCALEDLVESVS